jgi:hypothetical protein
LYQGFKTTVARKFKYSESQFQLWVLANQHMGYKRPAVLLPDDRADLSTLALLILFISPSEFSGSFRQGMKGIRDQADTTGDIWLSLNMIPVPGKEDKKKPSLPLRLLRLNPPQPPPDSSNAILIFLKQCDRSQKPILLVEKRYVHNDSKPSDIRDVINQKMGWRRYTRLLFYQVPCTPSRLDALLLTRFVLL